MSWGFGFGSDQWGGGSESASFGLALSSALAVRENTVRLSFNKSVHFTNLLDPNDGSNPAFYSVIEVDGTFGSNEQPSRPVLVGSVALVAGSSNTQIDVILDRPFTPWPSQYHVVVNGLIADDGSLLAGGFNTTNFYGVFRSIVPQVQALALSRGDIANPQTNTALSAASSFNNDPTFLGSYVVDDNGDYASDTGDIGLRKRIFRRIMSSHGKFAHLPTYGVGLMNSNKQLAKSQVRAKIASDIESQIKQEPEVQASKVTIVPGSQPGLVILKVLVKTITADSLSMSIPITIGGG